MLLEKKILALREELEEREAAMQVPYPLVIHSHSILPSWLSLFRFIKRRFKKVFQTVPNPTGRVGQYRIGSGIGKNSG